MEIKLIDVTKKFKKQEVLSHINLTFESENVYGLCGYNGSGKTMLMRAICGLLNIDSGKILIDNMEMKKDFDFPENMGFLLEGPAFLDEYSGFENLKILTCIKGKVEISKIEKTLNIVGLNPKDRRKYKKYSLGMKQRLGIAGAIIENPKLLILDEPTNALDEDGVEIVKKIIRLEKSKGTLVIIACHDKAFLKSISDINIYIKDGKIQSVERNFINE